MSISKNPQTFQSSNAKNVSNRHIFELRLIPQIQLKCRNPSPFPLIPAKKIYKRIVGAVHGSYSNSAPFSFPEYFLNFFLKASRFSSSVCCSFLRRTRLPSSSGAPISILQSTSSMNMGAPRDSRSASSSVEGSFRTDDYSYYTPTLRLRCRIGVIVIISNQGRDALLLLEER